MSRPFKRGDYILTIGDGPGSARENLHRLIAPDESEKPPRYWRVTCPGRGRESGAIATYVVVSPERTLLLTRAQVKTILAR